MGIKGIDPPPEHIYWNGHDSMIHSFSRVGISSPSSIPTSELLFPLPIPHHNAPSQSRNKPQKLIALKIQLLGRLQVKPNLSQPHSLSTHSPSSHHITTPLPSKCATKQHTPTPAPTKSKPRASSALSPPSPQSSTPLQRQKSLSSSRVQHALLDWVSPSRTPTSLPSLHHHHHHQHNSSIKSQHQHQLTQYNKSPAPDHGEHHFPSRAAARPRRDWSSGRERGDRLCIIGFLLLLLFLLPLLFLHLLQFQFRDQLLRR